MPPKTSPGTPPHPPPGRRLLPFLIAAILGLGLGMAVAATMWVALPPGGAGEPSTPAAVGRALAAGAAVAAGLGFLAMIAVAWMATRGARRAGEGGAGKAVRRRDPAVMLLAVLQREGRLIDFLREDIAAYSDEQVGAAARTIHASCRKVLDEHLPLEPVRAEEEGAKVAIQSGFDASTIRLTGKVSGKPPFRGILRHRGWRTRRVELPTDPEGQDPSIVAPAEVEIV